MAASDGGLKHALRQRSSLLLQMRALQGQIPQSALGVHRITFAAHGLLASGPSLAVRGPVRQLEPLPRSRSLLCRFCGDPVRHLATLQVVTGQLAASFLCPMLVVIETTLLRAHTTEATQLAARLETSSCNPAECAAQQSHVS